MASTLRLLFLLMISLNVVPALSGRVQFNDKCAILTGRGEILSLRCESASREDIMQAPVNPENFDKIFIDDASLEPFGSNEWNGFRNGRLIFIMKTDLTKLPETGFGQFKKLIGVNLSNNRIELISQNAFPAQTKLVAIYLQKNKIQTIEDGSFKAPSLEILDLSFNSLTDIDGKFRFLSGKRIER